MKLYEPPLRRPPIDLTKVKEKDVVIDFAMHEFRYDDKDLENFKKEILEYCSSEKELDEREIFWIKEG